MKSMFSLYYMKVNNIVEEVVKMEFALGEYQGWRERQAVSNRHDMLVKLFLLL